MHDRQYYGEQGRKWDRIVAWALISFAVFIAVFLYHYHSGIKSTELNLLGPVVGIILLIALAKFAFSKWRDSRMEPERRELSNHLNQIAPLPAFDASLSDTEQNKQREECFHKRLRAAYAFYETKYGRPLTGKDKKRIERMTGIMEEDVAPNTGDVIASVVGGALKAAVDGTQQSLEDIDRELEDYFGNKAVHFTRKDRLELLALSQDARLKRYKAIKELVTAKQESTESEPLNPDMEVNAEAVVIEEEPDSGIDPELLKEIKDETALKDFEILQDAKIRVEYEHDPKVRDERLRSFRNLILRYRESRGW